MVHLLQTCNTLQVGDELYLEKIPYGFLTLARYQLPAPTRPMVIGYRYRACTSFYPCCKTLKRGQNIENINLVYSVRTEPSWLMWNVFKKLPKLLVKGIQGFKFIPIITS